MVNYNLKYFKNSTIHITLYIILVGRGMHNYCVYNVGQLIVITKMI